MPRGRPKKSNETLNIEIRESKEVQLMSENEIDSMVDKFLSNETSPNRKLTETDERAIINLIKVINRYVCDVNTTAKISTEIIRHYYEGFEFRLESKCKYITQPTKDIVVDKFIIPFNVRNAPNNAIYSIRLSCVKYSYKSNTVTEETLCEF